MIKAQISIPDELYNKAVALAKDKELSLAEVFIQGIEYMTKTHHQDQKKKISWELPVIQDNPPKVSDPVELKNASFDDFDINSIEALRIRSDQY